MRLLPDDLGTSTFNAETGEVTMTLRPSPQALAALLDDTPYGKLLHADRILYAPGEISFGQRTCDQIAEGLGDRFAGGIVLEENPYLPPGYIALMTGSKLVGLITPESK